MRRQLAYTPLLPYYVSGPVNIPAPTVDALSALEGKPSQKSQMAPA